MTTIERLVRQLLDLGLRPGGVLVVHTSFRAIRPVDGGPSGLIEALLAALGPEGTLVMPTMSDGASVFDPRTTPTYEMGVTAETLWRRPDAIRSPHPGASFAAVGPKAAQVCAPHPLSPPHGVDSPVGHAHRLGAQVLLLGVGHDSNTTIHLAEAIAGVPYSVTHPCVVVVDGEVRTLDLAETDHCCRGFKHLDAWLGDRQRRGQVGSGEARLVEARELVDLTVERLRLDPLVFLCAPSEACEECDLARASVTTRAA